MLKKVLPWTISICLCLLVFRFTWPPPAFAVVDGLANAQDVLNNVLFGYPAQHKISFNVPSDSFPINNTDYVQIYLPNFTNISANILVSGDVAGTPVATLSGHYVRFTNVRVLPGGRLTIDGISADNPYQDSDFQVIIMVSLDEAATELKNYVNILATLNHANVTVSATIPNPLADLRISGYSAPDTFVIIGEASAVMGTDVVNGVGGFTRLFTGLQPTTHLITLYGIDTQNRTTSPIPLQIYTAASQLTTISNLLLSPTLQIDANQYLSGDNILASGSAYPGSDITLFVDSPLRTYYASSSASGDWTYTITNTSQFVYGDYRIYAMTQTSSGLQSLVSNSLNFSIVASGSAGTTTACGDISHGDLNCDTNIDLTDFSILMYYWASVEASADINGDGQVNLTDFSIMMYWWGT